MLKLRQCLIKLRQCLIKLRQCLLFFSCSFWKPKRQRFDACVGGALLILAPWDLDILT